MAKEQQTPKPLSVEKHVSIVVCHCSYSRLAMHRQLTANEGEETRCEEKKNSESH